MRQHVSKKNTKNVHSYQQQCTAISMKVTLITVLIRLHSLVSNQPITMQQVRHDSTFWQPINITCSSEQCDTCKHVLSKQVLIKKNSSYVTTILNVFLANILHQQH